MNRTKLNTNVLFLVALTFYLVGRCYEYTIWGKELETFINIVKIISYVLVIPCMLVAINRIMKKSFRMFWIMLFFLTFYLVYMILFDTNAGFVCFGFSIAAINIKQDNLFRYMQYVLVILFISVILFGISSNQVTVREFGNIRNRYSFGFLNPYSLQTLWMSIVTCSIIVRKRKSPVYFIFMILMTIIFQVAGDTRTTFVATIALLVFDYVLEKRKMKWNINKKHDHFILNNMFTIFFAIINSLNWIFFKTDSVSELVIDGMLTGRISITSRFIQYVCKGEIPIFPIQDVDFDLWEGAALQALVLDSSYSSMLFIDGALFSIITLIVLRKFVSAAIKENDVRIVAIMIAAGISGLLQPTLMSILYNPVILLTAFYIVENYSSGPSSARLVLHDMGRN